MDVRDALVTLARRWLLIFCCTLAGLGLSGGVLLTQPVVFSSTAALYISAVGASSPSDVSAGNVAGQQVAASMAEAATSPLLLNEVRKDLGLTRSVEEIASSVSVTVPANTVVMQITVNTDSPALAARIANGVAAEVANSLGRFNPNIGNRASVLKATLLERAQPDVAPIAPSPANILVVGPLIGFAVGIAIALLSRLLTRKISGASEIATVTDLPVVGTVPEVESSSSSAAGILTQDDSDRFSESMRELRANVRFLAPEQRSRVILVTSPDPEDGKSTVAANLAASMALVGQRTLLIDADMRRPSLHRRWGLDQTSGLSTVLIGADRLEDSTLLVGPSDLAVLTAGPQPPNPGELCSSPGFAKLLGEARLRYENIVVDTPPIQQTADALVLAPEADGVLVVVRANRTSTRDLRSALAKLRQNHAPVFGAVLARSDVRDLPKYYAAATR